MARFSYRVNGKPALHYSEEIQEIVYEIDGRFGLSLEYDSDAGVWLLVTSQAIPQYFLNKLTEAGTTYQDLSAPTMLEGTAVSTYIELPGDKYGNRAQTNKAPRAVEAYEVDGRLCITTPGFPYPTIDADYVEWWRMVDGIEPGTMTEREYAKIILSLDVPQWMKDAAKRRADGTVEEARP